MNNDILWKIDAEINKDKRVVELKKKSEILEENNKLLIQQKYEMYAEIDRLNKVIDKAIEYIKKQLSTETYQHLVKIYDDIDKTEEIWEEYEFDDLLEILGDKE